MTAIGSEHARQVTPIGEEGYSNVGLDWRIELPEFLGPFDLLLQLLQRRELDLSTASLAAIAHQFAEIVSQASDSIPLIETSEFAAVTAKLLTIKSAALLPSAEEEDGLAGEEDRPEIEDPTDLTEMLARYRELKSRASVLRQRTRTGLRCYRRSGPRIAVDAPPRVLISINELMRALLRVAARDRHRLRERRVGRDTLTLVRALRIIEDRVRRQPRVKFSQLVAGAGTTRQLITFFLATLEICKSGKATMDQQTAFGEIFLSKAD